MMKPTSPAADAMRIPASVIVAAHDRRRFLPEAIQSVLAQDVDRSMFELLVVKNFPDPEIDRLLDQRGARRILCSERPSSRKVAMGLRACRGDVVLLLDDDDLFEPDKLRIVLDEFRANPKLGFYHNQVSFIGADGAPLAASRARGFDLRPPGRARRVLLNNEAKSRGLSELAYCYPEFNSSSLAIRRDLAVDSFPFLTRIEGGVDTFFFFVALASPYALLFDDARLTRYRIHDGNTSLAGGADPESRRTRMLAAARKQDLVNRVTREMVAGAGSPSLLREVDARILVTRLSIMFRDPASGRFEAARALLRGIGLRRTLAVRENVPSFAGAFLLAVAPRLARGTYERRVSIR
jgi:glycosyltransferase involved in cell wall biosynthesis